jgi:glycine betaine/proline transport system ATP-binding protein
MFGLHIQNIDEKDANTRARRWIDRVGLSGYEEKYPQHLSGGMQQRVGLARALTNDGEILLMDEAFSALDPLIRKDMQDILLELQDELHKTVVFITHDLDEALKVGDRIAILKDGIMDQEGIPADILLSPKTQYVKDFVEDVNRARVIKAKHIMSKLNGQDRDNAMFVDQDDFIDRFIDKVISDKPNCLIIKNKNNDEIGYLSTKRLSEILKR